MCSWVCQCLEPKATLEKTFAVTSRFTVQTVAGDVMNSVCAVVLIFLYLKGRGGCHPGSVHS